MFLLILRRRNKSNHPLQMIHNFFFIRSLRTYILGWNLGQNCSLLCLDTFLVLDKYSVSCLLPFMGPLFSLLLLGQSLLDLPVYFLCSHKRDAGG
ncbi:hypothetical protein DVH24_018346 [Malus domestica]|uniref:Uncharacterized protein n=1 Tax=Malus domestica TaxID=3750 RepID=A0A498KIR6_MALDO|nr:hypothetical protein DVH24_018346 [Malus domestica]